ncbi:GNAT family N-acetyltransferase [Chitinivorax sp. B]|uniref:GNAT family N-acetyltransferase n=1 Tax=Chitinivorax sp. B TaxID=2502235 RepID=UPI001484F2B0|nr:GNAT family N-acetyltransferase [Chitinivorax sp. B]
MFDSASILIRRANVADVPTLTEIYAHPAIREQLMQLPHMDQSFWRDWITNAPPTRHILIAEQVGEIVGEVTLSVMSKTPRKHCGSIAPVVRADRHRQGIGNLLMTSVLDLADNWLNLQRLELQVLTYNEPAIALYKKHGFDIEGTLRHFAFRDGRYVDAHMMARLR